MGAVIVERHDACQGKGANLSTMKKFYDIVLVGGGLANGLVAYRMAQVRPDIEFLLLEQNRTWGGDHTWSFHETDLTPLEWSWVAPLVSKSWDATTVQFPAFKRTLSQRYHSIRSGDFHDKLLSVVKYQDGLGQKIVDVTPTQVVLENGFAIQASCVIDGRGWRTTPRISEGFQKFYGCDVLLDAPHKLEHPILMDATVPQEDGYRFIYMLPWDENRMLVEDTYYSDVPFLNIEKLKEGLFAHIKNKGWNVVQVEREEHGVLSIPLGGAAIDWDEGVPYSGSRGGFFHATTGYSLPWAVHFAEGLAHLGTFEATRVFAEARDWAQKHWSGQSFFRMLNRMLFRACEPQNRYKILENFYRQPDRIIEHFYKGQLSAGEKIRMFLNKPPVPVRNALGCLWETSNL